MAYKEKSDWCSKYAHLKAHLAAKGSAQRPSVDVKDALTPLLGITIGTIFSLAEN